MKQIKRSLAFLSAFAIAGVGGAFAGEADVVDVKATQASDGTWRFDVAVLHADDGWDHYADKWAVFAPDGTMLGERVLAHPHDNEQPFTRSQSGIEIPSDIKKVIVRAHDSVHAWGGKEITVDVNGS